MDRKNSLSKNSLSSLTHTYTHPKTHTKAVSNPPTADDDDGTPTDEEAVDGEDDRRHLPMEFWTTKGLSTVASGVGKPLYLDAITRACTRLDFARVCVMIDVTQTLRKRIIIMNPDEDGGETPGKVDVEYEWLPPKCTDCVTLGHSGKECTLTKPQK
ncbi:UNVERIFIED_CONTAM: hypothetical protein Sindi_0944900 [Sesamum indicum]